MTHSKFFDIDMRFVIQSDKSEDELEEALRGLFHNIIKPLGKHGMVMVDYSTFFVDENTDFLDLDGLDTEDE